LIMHRCLSFSWTLLSFPSSLSHVCKLRGAVSVAPSSSPLPLLLCPPAACLTCVLPLPPDHGPPTTGP
jgi:hypothetical protein